MLPPPDTVGMAEGLERMLEKATESVVVTDAELINDDGDVVVTGSRVFPDRIEEVKTAVVEASLSCRLNGTATWATTI